MPLVNVNGIRLYHEVHGQGAPVVLLAGTARSGDLWTIFTVPALVEAGFSAIILDYRGVGRSDKPGGKYTIDLFAQDTVALLEHLGIERAHVAGHSMGGRVAQIIALNHRSRVRSLTLLASGSGHFDPKLNMTRGIPLETAMELAELGWERYFQATMADETHLTQSFVLKHGDLVDTMRRNLRDHAPTLETFLRHVMARQEFDTTQRLAEISIPTLVMVGSQDTSQGGTGSHLESSRHLATHIFGAQFHLVPGVRHWLFIESPEETHRVLVEFLKAH